MRFSLVSLASAVLAAAAVEAVSTFPALSYLGTLNINITAGQNIPVYGGTRVVNSYLGGYATDPAGTTIANIVPYEGGEGGLTDPHGLFRPSVRAILKFVKEEYTYAFLTMQGVKNGTEFLFVTGETNSTAYDYLNKLFIIANATKTQAPNDTNAVLHFDLFSPGPGLPF